MFDSVSPTAPNMFSFNGDNFTPQPIVSQSIPVPQIMLNANINQIPVQSIPTQLQYPQMITQPLGQTFMPNPDIIPQQTVVQQLPLPQQLPTIQPIGLPLPIQQEIESKKFTMPLSYKNQVEHIQPVEMPNLSSLEKKINNIDKLSANELTDCKFAFT
jgi:hypothetical protein